MKERKLQPFGLLIAATVLSSLPIFCVSAHNLEPALQKAAQDYDRAQITGNRRALERLVADDYILLNSKGKQEGKAELIDGFCHPGFHLNPYHVEEPFTKLLNDTAILGGLVEFRGTDAGKSFEQRMRFADVWSKRNGRWTVVFTQTTPIAK